MRHDVDNELLHDGIRAMFVNKVIESREGLAVAGELLMSISKDERERRMTRRSCLRDRPISAIASPYSITAFSLLLPAPQGLRRRR